MLWVEKSSIVKCPRHMIEKGIIPIMQGVSEPATSLLYPNKRMEMEGFLQTTKLHSKKNFEQVDPARLSTVLDELPLSWHLDKEE